MSESTATCESPAFLRSASAALRRRVSALSGATESGGCGREGGRGVNRASSAMLNCDAAHRVLLRQRLDLGGEERTQFGARVSACARLGQEAEEEPVAEQPGGGLGVHENANCDPSAPFALVGRVLVRERKQQV